MNVYEKLNLARVQFQSKGIKKSGKNDYIGYNYFELTDILPACNEICSELKATCVVTFGDIAELKFIDAEKPEDFISFTCPMSEVNQKNSQPVQNLGSVQTYIKRYLYQNCFEIAENDSLDAVTGKVEQPAKPAQTQASKPAPQKKPVDNELNQLKNTVQQAIARGDLKGEALTHAKEALNANDKNRLSKCVDYLQQKEQAKETA